MKVSIIAGFIAAHPLSATIALACSSEKAAQPVRPLSVAEVDSQRTRSVFIFDANSNERFAKGHVPGAKWLTFDAVSADKLPADKSSVLIFYCYNEMCSASTSAANAAVRLGYSRVYVMPEGIKGWEKAGKPVEKSERRS